MGKRNLGEQIHVVPLLAPVLLSASSDITGINMGLFNKVDFIIALGDLSTANFTLTMVADTAAANTSATALAFEYRVSAAAGTDTMGDVTAVASTGLELANATYDNMTILVSMDSDALTAGKPYCRPVLTDAGTADAYVSITALCYPRYPQATPSLALT